MMLIVRRFEWDWSKEWFSWFIQKKRFFCCPLLDQKNRFFWCPFQVFQRCSFEKYLIIWLIPSRLNKWRELLMIQRLKWCFRMLIWWIWLKRWSDWFRWRWWWGRKSIIWLFPFFRQLSFFWNDRFFQSWSFKNWSSQSWSFSCRRVLRSTWSSWSWSWLCLPRIILWIPFEVCLEKKLNDVWFEVLV